MAAFFPAIDVQQDFVGTNADGLLRNNVKKAIYTAVVAGSNPTASISIGSATEQGLLSILDELAQKGFTYTLGSSSFTVGW